MKEKVAQVQEAQRVPNKLDPKRPTLRRIIIKMIRFYIKKRILKAAREKQGVSYKGVPIRLSSDFLTEIYQARTRWHKIFNEMKSKVQQPRILYSAMLAFRRRNKELPR